MSIILSLHNYIKNNYEKHDKFLQQIIQSSDKYHNSHNKIKQIFSSGESLMMHHHLSSNHVIVRSDTNYLSEKFENINLKIMKPEKPSKILTYVYVVMASLHENKRSFPLLENIDIIQNLVIEAELKKNKIHFHPLLVKDNKIVRKDNILMYIFTDDFFFKTIPNIKERTAVYLHEIGHFSSANKSLLLNQLIYSLLQSYAFLFMLFVSFFSIFIANPFISSIAGLSNIIVLISIFVLICLMYISNKYGMLQEYKADEFAKNLGYGEDLAKALLRLTYPNLSKNSDLKNKITEIQKSNNLIISTLKDLFFNPFRIHPSTNNRIIKLTTESILDDTIDMISDNTSSFTNEIVEELISAPERVEIATTKLFNLSNTLDTMLNNIID